MPKSVDHYESAMKSVFNRYFRKASYDGHRLGALDEDTLFTINAQVDEPKSSAVEPLCMGSFLGQKKILAGGLQRP